MSNFLTNWRRRRDANALAASMAKSDEYMRHKAMVDSARPSSVGAPGGIPYKQNQLAGSDFITTAGAMGSFMPVIGDAVGLATDARYLYQNPEERTPFNIGMAGLGALPFIPSMTAMTRGGDDLIDALDMGHDARMARAREQGYDVNDTLYHGSTHDIERFHDPAHTGTYYEPDSYYGKGIYLSDSIDDVNPNYAGEGPDLTNRLEREAEMIADSDYGVIEEAVEELYDAPIDELTSDEIHEAALHAARQNIKGENEGVVYPLLVNREGVVDEWESLPNVFEETKDFDYYLKEAAEELGDAEDYEIDDMARDLKDADMANDFDNINSSLSWIQDQDPDAAARVADAFMEAAYDGYSPSIDDIVAALGDAYITDWDTGGMMTNRAVAAEIARDIAGIKGVRMDAGKAFPHMAGTQGATHTIMFDPSQIRSVNAKFDPDLKTSSNLLATVAPAAVGLGVANSLYSPESDNEI